MATKSGRLRDRSIIFLLTRKFIGSNEAGLIGRGRGTKTLNTFTIKLRQEKGRTRYGELRTKMANGQRIRRK